ncbi:MAG: hypothetical protein GZ087_13725 [Flavobacterium sp.]|nr:hypothetical protein [Flavobacterium sp.]
MTEEQLNGFKELAESLNQNTQQAFEIYKEAVDKIDDRVEGRIHKKKKNKPILPCLDQILEI